MVLYIKVPLAIAVLLGACAALGSRAGTCEGEPCAQQDNEESTLLQGLKRATGAQGSSFQQVPAVTLPSGAKVVGKVLPASDALVGSVNAYFNIRYAEAARFEVPVAYTPPPDAVVDGTIMNEQCPQDPVGTGVEDCLTLAVYTPPGPLKQGRAVMVWIHGGNLVKGNIKDFAGALNPIVLVGDVVVVAVQYRLNIFGFLSFPGADASVPANCGLRDQIEALKWVQSNIGSFGGDPGSVTIWGQSAGGRSVIALYHSPMAVGLFQRAIAHSPGLTPAMFNVPTSRVAATLGKRCLKATGCDSLPCLKNLNTTQIAAQCSFVTDPSVFLKEPGVYLAGYDGEVLTEPIYTSLCKGSKVASGDKPILVGGLAHEFRLFASKFLLNADAVHRFFWEYLKAYKESSKAAQECVMKKFAWEPYAGASCILSPELCEQVGPAPLEAFATAAYSLGIALGMGSGEAKRYRYVLDIDAAGGKYGSNHGMDLGLMFGVGQPASPEYSKKRTWKHLVSMLRQYWVSFANTGVPHSDLGPRWPPVDVAAGTWGLPRMEFNLSSDLARSSSVSTDRRQQLMTDLLCGKVAIPSECSGL